MIRDRYKVRMPPLTESQLEDLHSLMIYQQCQDKATFMLDRMGHGLLERPNRRRKSELLICVDFWCGKILTRKEQNIC